MFSTDDEENWEEVPLSHQTEQTKEDNEERNIEITVSSSTSSLGKRKRSSGITKQQKQLNESIHKSHLLCLLFHSFCLNRLLDNEELQSLILSVFTELKMFEKLKSGKKSLEEVLYEKFSSCQQGIQNNFEMKEQEDDSTQYSFQSISEAISEKKVPNDTFKDILLVLLLRALGLETRLIVCLKAVPFRQSVKRKPVFPLKFLCEVLLEKKQIWIALSKDRHELISQNQNVLHEFAYIVSIESHSNHLQDVTRFYHSQFMNKLKKLRLTEWWTFVLNSFQFETRFPKSQVLDTHSEQLPTSIQDFLNHPKYVLERHEKKYEFIYPKMPENVLGQIRGENIYPRSLVHTLHTAEKWLSIEGRMVKPGEQPVKYVKSRVMPTKKRSSILLPEYDDDDNSSFTLMEKGQKMVGLFGQWQTETYQPPPIVNGIIPKNKYNNMDLFQPSMLPKGAVHLTETELLKEVLPKPLIDELRFPSLKKLARQLKIDFAEAVTGFGYHGGRSVPVVTGIVIAEENEEVFRKEYLSLFLKELEKQQKLKELEILERWEKLTKKLLIKKRLNKKYNIQT